MTCNNMENSDSAVLNLTSDHPLWDAVAEELMQAHGQDRRFMGAPLSIVLASVAGTKLQGFGIFHDMRDPDRHQGTSFDIEATERLLDMEGVGLFRIALIHSIEGPDHLGDLTKQLLSESEKLLSSKYDNHALMIPLMKKANEPAFDLWRGLGFKERGLSSYYLETDLTPHAGLPPSISLPKGVTACFMDGMAQYPLNAIAECYARIFLTASKVEAAEKIVSSILNSPGFAPELSMLARHDSSNRVVGFLLAERSPDSKSVNITVVGLLPEYRGRGLPFYGFPRFAARCLDRGIVSATQMTSTKKVVRLVSERLKGEIIDEMVWMIRAR
jgi:GNAT superfamily N-acetyltransferase